MMEERFSVGDRVSWKQIRGDDFPHKHLYPEELIVVKIQEVSPEWIGVVGHSQWVFIRNNQGQVRKFSGKWFQRKKQNISAAA